MDVRYVRAVRRQETLRWTVGSRGREEYDKSGNDGQKPLAEHGENFPCRNRGRVGNWIVTHLAEKGKEYPKHQEFRPP